MKQRKNPPKRNENDARATLQLPKALLDKFKRRAKADDRTLSSWMRHELAKLVGADETNGPKS